MQYTAKIVMTGKCGTDQLGIGFLVRDWCETHRVWHAQTGMDGILQSLALAPGPDGIPEVLQKYTFSGMLPEGTEKETLQPLFQGLSDFLQERLDPTSQKIPVEVTFGLKIR